MRRKRKPRVVHVHGRRWFERVNGNTYHTADIWVDGEHVHKVPFTYGYGDHWMQSATEWLDANGYMPEREHYNWGGGELASVYFRERGVKLVQEVDDVPRRKDL